MDLLFELVTWHSLAKLHLHTTSTLDALENSTTRLGSTIWKFTSTTCKDYVTTELASEEAARGCCKAAKAKKKKAKLMSQRAKMGEKSREPVSLGLSVNKN